ncbi:conjugal transfer protein [Pseudomaricurvus alkylphenolicus]|uniref:integrative conjugative element protein, RAQPRD family n=1 Tax=Pseudomaricurvus alkylphenolicus TaxID=1306991 RepID=UPI00141F5C9B|nr:RAQPRD family integrative conjugative element protein [Pseudomaricurvus alkylphenolicus]NIB44045.1 conjugal transfer protein [Pseudomaricurvus alkylphenolicus]
MRKSHFVIAGLVSSLWVTPSIWADADAERETLATLLHELQSLESLISKAEAQRHQDTRIQFRYDWLRQDIERIESGIQSHIDAPRSQPRRYAPLRGDYRR